MAQVIGRDVGPTESAFLLEMKDVSVHFGGVVALDRVSMSVAMGQVVGLIGPNGAGKTTLVNVATGVVRPSNGDVLLDGVSIGKLGPARRSRLGVTRTFQHPQLIEALSILENVMLGFDRRASATMGEAVLHLPRSRSDEKRIRRESFELLELTGIADFAEREARLVPFGVQRRAELSRALSTNPRFVMLDEAGAGLNDEERSSIIGAVRQASAMPGGPGWIVIEHNIEFVRELCPTTVVLVNGKVLVEGVTSTVLKDSRVIDVYLGSEDVYGADDESDDVNRSTHA
jgi:branched-chain amino acid transport system ATP-binding protein